MADKLKQTAADEVEHVKKLTVEGLQSRTYLYPLKVRRRWLCYILLLFCPVEKSFGKKRKRKKNENEQTTSYNNNIY